LDQFGEPDELALPKNEDATEVEQLSVLLRRCEDALKTVSKLHNDVVERFWTKDTERQKWICMQPFERVVIGGGGKVTSCCSSHVKKGHIFGNAFTDSYEEIWNSDNAKKLRYSVARGNFEYCYDICGVLQNKESCPETIFPREQSPYSFDQWQSCRLDSSPKIINLACDPSCNLRCVSCRRRLVVSSEEKSKRIYEMLINVVTPMLKNCKLLTISGGEFFVSNAYQAFVKTLNSQKYPQLKLEILTNAQLFTPSRWSQLETMHDMTSIVRVSIDAASKETYERTRIGGVWDKLCNNMAFISSLRHGNKIDKLFISFVVQQGNFREMPQFVELGKKWGVDKVGFARLSNFGAYTLDEHKQSDVFDSSHIQYEEAKNILQKIKVDTKDIEVRENCLSRQIEDI